MSDLTSDTRDVVNNAVTSADDLINKAVADLKKVFDEARKDVNDAMDDMRAAATSAQTAMTNLTDALKTAGVDGKALIDFAYSESTRLQREALVTASGYRNQAAEKIKLVTTLQNEIDRLVSEAQNATSSNALYNLLKAQISQDKIMP